VKAIKQDGKVQLFGPTPSKPGVYRVLIRSGGKQVERTATGLPAATALYDLMVKADRARMPAFARKGPAPKTMDITSLAELTVAELVANNRSTRYVEKVEDILRLHVLPTIGDLAVEDWTPTHSKKVLTIARGPRNDRKLSDATVQDVGAAMRAMVSQAHRSKPRLLLKEDDPMEGVSYSVGSTIQGQAASYVEPNQRPPTTAVVETYQYLKQRSETHIFGQKPGLPGRPWMALPVLIMGFGGLRLGECLALRKKDIARNRISVNGTVEASNRAGSVPTRKETKNRRKRETVLPPWVGKIVTAYAATFTDPEAKLFPNPSGGWTRTNNFWQVAVSPAIDDGVWDHKWDFENLRHHAATYWHDAGVPIETISQIMGHHSTSFTYDTYFRTHEDSLHEAAVLLAKAKAPKL
jgi:integrase